MNPINTSYLRAAVPLLSMGLLAIGVKVSPELLSFVVDNVGAILVASGALAGAFPSFLAAFRWKASAD
jgi:hypothetical protein